MNDNAPQVVMNVYKINDCLYVKAEEAHAAVTKAREQERAACVSVNSTEFLVETKDTINDLITALSLTTEGTASKITRPAVERARALFLRIVARLYPEPSNGSKPA